MSELYKLQIDERGVARVCLTRAKLHNAFNAELIEQLTEVFLSFKTNQNIRLVVLEAEGKSFCAGADLNWMKGMAKYTQEENFKDSLKLYEMFETINSCPLPVLCKIQGAALGGGVGLVAVSDFCLSCDTAVFALTEVRLGLVPAVISPFVISKIGESQARAYFLSGSKINAKRARDIGLVHDISTVEELDDNFERAVENFLKTAPKATMVCKNLIKDVVGKDIQSQKNHTAGVISKMRVAEEGQEGMIALLEKRKPIWK